MDGYLFSFFLFWPIALSPGKDGDEHEWAETKGPTSWLKASIAKEPYEPIAAHGKR